jgi:hypothetical protein
MKGKDGPTVTSTSSSGSTACKDTAYKAGPLLRALTTAALMTLPQFAEVQSHVQLVELFATVCNR